LDLQLPVQSVPITTNVESLDPVLASLEGVLNMTLCDKICPYLWFSPGTPVSLPIKLTATI